MARKYEFTGETKEVDGCTLHRIRAVRDIDRFLDRAVGEGAIGGWIGSESNLSHDGSCWVEDEACVYGCAKVFGDARVCGDAKVCGYALVGDRAKVFGEAFVSGSSELTDAAEVYGMAEVMGAARVYGRAKICDHAALRDCAHVHGHAVVKGHAAIFSAHVFGDATVCGFANVDGLASICGDVVIEHSYDYVVFKNTWSSLRFFTYTRPDHMWCVGCFRGTGEELIEKAYKDDELKGKCYEIIVRAAEQVEAAEIKAREELEEQMRCQHE